MQTTDKTETKRTKFVISNGNGGTMVLSITGNPSAVATKFFHDAIKHKRQNNSMIYKTIQKDIPTTDDQSG